MVDDLRRAARQSHELQQHQVQVAENLAEARLRVVQNLRCCMLERVRRGEPAVIRQS